MPDAAHDAVAARDAAGGHGGAHGTPPALAALLETSRRPKRADAQRNFDALLAAGREAFTELGPDAPLEEIARRAGVGIATLYRNFPTREDLIESVYIDEVAALWRAADETVGQPPWDRLIAWLHRFETYIGTKRVLLNSLNRSSDAFKAARVAMYGAGEPLLVAAQEVGEVRPDATIDDVVRLVSGLSAVEFVTPEQRERVLSIALDGFRVTR